MNVLESSTNTFASEKQEENIPEFIMLVGLPASGKSTWAKESDYNNIFSSDAIREELFHGEYDKEQNSTVFKILHRRVKNCLIEGKSCVYDATNLSSKRRRSFLQDISRIKCHKRCIIFATSYEECVDRNAKRDNRVPIDAVWDMYKSFDFPMWCEGWDSISILWDTESVEKSDTVVEAVRCVKNYDQNNSHHSLTLGEHLLRVGEYARDMGDAEFGEIRWGTVLGYAGLLHDIRKPKVASGFNSRGELTDEYHYYDHEHISAYDAMFILKKSGVSTWYIIEVCTLISLHMHFYTWTLDKTKERYKRIWGEDLYRRVKILHDADMAAR